MFPYLNLSHEKPFTSHLIEVNLSLILQINLKYGFEEYDLWTVTGIVRENPDISVSVYCLILAAWLTLRP
jgi:hypothetical protein